MCGIAGMLHPGAGPHDAEVEAMIRTLAHRGPNSVGCERLGPASLAQHRLSVLDTTDAGVQPMRSADGRRWIVHNGEIYNFLELADELRAAGHAFRSRTDTEVILAAFAEWGEDAVQRFNGIWAFALWDGRNRTLTLSRDRLGVKPLYFVDDGRTVAFASEIKALLSLPTVRREPNPSAVRDFLVDGLVDHSGETFFTGIRCVPAAHTLTISLDGSRRMARYWERPELSDDASFDTSPADEEAVDAVRSLLTDSVALQLRSDVALGSCLSGGLDSSSIVSFAAALRGGKLSRVRAHAERDANPQLAFHAEFADPAINERAYVDAVVRNSGVELRTVTPTAADFVEILPDVLAHQDEPFASSSIVVQYFVMRLAHDAGVTVLLDGQGADELFGGYPPFLRPRLGGALRQGLILPVLASLRGRPDLLAPVLKFAALGARPLPQALRSRRTLPSLGEVARRAPTLWAPPDAGQGTVLARVLWDQLTRTSLPSLLRYEDRNSMAFGIEARVPFLDHRLVETALRLPDRLKLDAVHRKLALRRAVRGVVPPQVLQRRDKMGFEAPQVEWMKAAAPRLKWLGRRPASEEAGYLRPGEVSGSIARMISAQADAATWRMLNLEMWLRTRIVGK